MDGDDKVLDGGEKVPENGGKLQNRTKKIMKKAKKKSAGKEKTDSEPHVTGEQLLALALQGQCHERGETAVFYLKHRTNRSYFWLYIISDNNWVAHFKGISRDTVPLKIVRGDNVSLKNRRRRQQITAAAPEPPEPIDEEETILEDMPPFLEDSLPSLEDTLPSLDDPTTEDGTKRFG